MVDRRRFALLTSLAVDNCGSGLFLPLALLYATRVVGLPVNVAGTAVAAGTLLSFGVPPLAARLSHGFGPRFVVIAAQLVQALGAVGYLLAGDAPGVFVGACLLAGGAQLFYCAIFVLIADVTEDEAKERPFALVGMVRAAAFGLGNLGAALALVVGGDGAFRFLVGLDAASFVVAAALLAAFVVTEPVDRDAAAVGPVTVLRDREYRALIGAVCLIGLAVDVALVGTPVYVLDVVGGPAWLPGALLAGATVLSSVLGVKVVDLLRGLRRTRSLRVSAAMYAAWALLSMAMVWLPGGWLVPYAFGTWLVLVAANKVFFPVSGALSEALPPRAARAGYLATFQYAFTAAQVLAPAVVGLFAVAGWLPWAVVAASSVAGVVVLRRLGGVIPVAIDRVAATQRDIT